MGVANHKKRLLGAVSWQLLWLCICNYSRLRYHQESDANTEEDSRKVIPYIAPGPSKVQELVPMKTLKNSISLSEQEGLVYLDHTSLSHYFQCRTRQVQLRRTCSALSMLYVLLLPHALTPTNTERNEALHASYVRHQIWPKTDYVFFVKINNNFCTW